MRLSARGYHRVLRVARTLADLDGAEKIGRAHLAEALSYRALADEVRRAAWRQKWRLTVFLPRCSARADGGPWGNGMATFPAPNVRLEARALDPCDRPPQ
jgi:hypothetical protein